MQSSSHRRTKPAKRTEQEYSELLGSAYKKGSEEQQSTALQCFIPATTSPTCPGARCLFGFGKQSQEAIYPPLR